MPKKMYADFYRVNAGFMGQRDRFFVPPLLRYQGVSNFNCNSGKCGSICRFCKYKNKLKRCGANKMLNNQRNENGVLFAIGLALVLLVGVFFIFGMPMVNVWRQGLAGEAELKRAEFNRQIVVREAEAKKQAASLLADAEIERAKGVAEANRIIGNSLKDNENYLRYLWIHNLEEGSNQVIYVPTEAGLPILEAGKRAEVSPQASK